MTKPDVTVFFEDNPAYAAFKVSEYLQKGYVIKDDPDKKYGDGVVLEYRGSDEQNKR